MRSTSDRGFHLPRASRNPSVVADFVQRRHDFREIHDGAAADIHPIHIVRRVIATGDIGIILQVDIDERVAIAADGFNRVRAPKRGVRNVNTEFALAQQTHILRPIVNGIDGGVGVDMIADFEARTAPRILPSLRIHRRGQPDLKVRPAGPSVSLRP